MSENFYNAVGDLAKERDQLRAELEALKALTKIGDTCLACGGTGGHWEDCHGTTALIALQAELEQAKRREAALKDALSALISEATCFHDYNVHGDCCGTCTGLADAVENAEKSLQPDAGRDYLSREQVRPLVEALRNAHTIRGSVDKGLEHAKQLGL